MSRYLGLGLRQSATPEALAQMLAAIGPVDAVACLARKRGLPALSGLTRATPQIWIDDAQLGGVQTATSSPRILAHYGTGSVAEALALLAARHFATGPDAPRIWLSQKRQLSACGCVTVAVATVEKGAV